jgi:ribonuclease HI
MITGGDSAVAAEGCILRAARICGKPVIANCGVTLEVVKDDYLLRSVIEWGATANRHLRFGGPDPAGTTNELASSVINDESLIETLEGMDDVTLGDLTEIVEEKGTHVRKWVSRKKLRAAKLGENNEAAGIIEAALNTIPVPIWPITIRAGTCLILEGSLTTDILEFLGWIEERACVCRWTPVKKGDRCTPGTWYTLSAENISRGAGSDDTVDPAVLLAPSRRVLMSSDIKTGLKKKRHLTRKVQIVLDQGILEFPKPPPPHPLWAELAGSFGLSPMAVDIYTDGTWEKNKGTINDVFMYGDGSHTNAAAGIVITARGENWRELGVRTITISEGGMLNADSVFPFELMAAVVAIKIAASLETHNCRIHTDCQSVQKLLTQRNLLRTLSRKENLILLQLGTSETEHIDKNWIPGHPERTVPDKAQWTKHMWGNHIADATAAGEWDGEESDLYGEHTTISVRDILQAMSKEPRWMWVDSTGIPITTSIPKDIRCRRQ